MVNQTYNYRSMLKSEYQLRKNKNEQYSKTAFARDLGLHQSKLTQILNGSSGVSPARATEIAKRIEMPLEEEELFLTLVETEHARSPLVKQRAQKRLKLFLDDDTSREKITALQILKKWTHIAVLNLLSQKKESSPETLANKLGVHVKDILDSLKLLEEVHLVSQNSKGFLSSAHKLISSFDLPSQLIKEHHKQYLKKAAEALESVSVEHREFISLSFKASPDDLPKMKTEIRKFIKNFDKKFAQTDSPQTELYQTMLQLYPITKSKTKESL